MENTRLKFLTILFFCVLGIAITTKGSHGQVGVKKKKTLEERVVTLEQAVLKLQLEVAHLKKALIESRLEIAATARQDASNKANLNQSSEIARSTTPDVIETKLRGEFEGWDGETVFILDNGQIWQQSSYAYTYHYAYRPNVLIFKTIAGYKMKVDGVDETIHVRKLK